MFGKRKRRKDKTRRQTLEQVESIEAALLRRVLPIIEREHGMDESAALSRSVVDMLLAKPRNGNGRNVEAVRELAGAIVRQDKQVRDSSFASLRVMLAIDGETNNFAGERRILEAIFWLKQFGELPPQSHDPDSLVRLAADLKAPPLMPSPPSCGD